MNSRKKAFFWPQQGSGRTIAARFGLREPKDRKRITKEQSIFTYAHPGHGVQGESSN